MLLRQLHLHLFTDLFLPTYPRESLNLVACLFLSITHYPQYFILPVIYIFRRRKVSLVNPSTFCSVTRSYRQASRHSQKLYGTSERFIIIFIEVYNIIFAQLQFPKIYIPEQSVPISIFISIHFLPVRKHIIIYVAD